MREHPNGIMAHAFHIMKKSSCRSNYFRVLASRNPNGAESSSVIPSKAIPRLGEQQAKGDYYLIFDTLRRLDEYLLSFQGDRSRTQKKDLLMELSVTYFARMHNLVREEYQFEKRAVEERLKSWPESRLRREGFVLADLNVSRRGSLFQDRVLRFYAAPSSQYSRQGSPASSPPLPFHRFGVGDSVRISKMLGGGAGAVAAGADSQGVDGIVLDRRPRYLDVCVSSTSAMQLDTQGGSAGTGSGSGVGVGPSQRSLYRLDQLVNRVAFDRMLVSLQAFLQAGDGEGRPLSRAVRDLLLYSYPNGMLTLAAQPGGLRLGLPPAPVEVSSSRASSSLSGAAAVLSMSEESSMSAATLDVSRQLTQELRSRRASTRTASRRRASPSPSPATNTTGVRDDSDNSNTGDTGNGGGVAREVGVAEVEEAEGEGDLDMEMLTELFEDGEEGGEGQRTSREGGGGGGGGPLTVAQALRLAQETEQARGEGKEESGPGDLDEIVRMFGRISGAAVRETARGRGSQSLEEEREGMHVEDGGVFQSNARLRAMSEHWPTTSSSTPFTPTEVRRVLSELFSIHQLNPSQSAALTAALARPLTLIQGPPGTGKTRTACAILAAVAQLKAQRMRVGGEGAKGLKGLRMLACAHSNVATDNLLDGLLRLGVRVVRVGRPANIRSSLWNHTLDALLQSEPAWQRARMRLDSAVSQYSAARDGGQGGEQLGIAQRVLAAAKVAFERQEQKSVVEVLAAADVVVASCIGAGVDILSTFTKSEAVRFDTVLIDEAAQCMEPACLPAIVHGCERLILVGDQNQLPPVIASPLVLEKGLGISLFSRLAAAGLPPLLLNEQYRMHPSIAEFPSAQFYSGLLQSRVLPADRPLPPGLDWPNPAVPVVFIDVCPLWTDGRHPLSVEYPDPTEGAAVPIGGGFERLSSTSTGSFDNQAEAAVVDDVVSRLLGAGVSLSDIGVISPYSAQVRLISERCRRRGWLESGSLSEESEAENAGQERKRGGLKWRRRGSHIGLGDSSRGKGRDGVQDGGWQAGGGVAGDWSDGGPFKGLVSSEDAPPVTQPARAALVEESESDRVEPYSVSLDNEGEETPVDAARGSALEVKTVDGFQGREKDVIIISAVRSNRQGRIGFLQDWRRLNVAITRARSGLVVVGDSNTIKNERNWRAFLDWCESSGCYTRAAPDLLDRLAD